MSLSVTLARDAAKRCHRHRWIAALRFDCENPRQRSNEDGYWRCRGDAGRSFTVAPNALNPFEGSCRQYSNHSQSVLIGQGSDGRAMHATARDTMRTHSTMSTLAKATGTAPVKKQNRALQKRQHPDEIRHQMRTFIADIDNGRIQNATMIPQMAEQLLQQLVSIDELKDQDGIMANRVLEQILKRFPNAQRGCRNLPYLFSMTIQTIQSTSHPQAHNQSRRLLHELLTNHRSRFVKNVSYNTLHVNSAFQAILLGALNGNSDTYNIEKNDNQRWKRNIRMDRKTIRYLDELLQKMDRLWSDRHVPLRRNDRARYAIVQYLCRKGKPDEALKLMKDSIQPQQQNPHDDEGNSKSHNAHAPTRFENIQHDLVLASFSSILSTYARYGWHDKATDIIQWMLDRYNRGKQEGTESNDNFPPPNQVCFNALLNAHAQGGSTTQAGYKAQQVLQWMEDLHNGPDKLDTKPDELSYNICANAWAATTQDRDSPQKAEAILQRMLQLQAGGGDVRPSAYTFATVMNAWARSGDANAPAQIKALIQTMEILAATTTSTNTNDDDDGGDNDTVDATPSRPSVTRTREETQFEVGAIPYTILLTSYERQAHRCKSASQKLRHANDVLDVMFEMKAKGIQRTAPALNALMMALLALDPVHALVVFFEVEQEYSRGITNGQAPTVHLDTMTFNSALSAIAALNRPDVVDQSFALLSRMGTYSTNDPNIAPDATTYNIAMKALSRSHLPDAGDRANALLDRMMYPTNDETPVRPDFFSFISIILTWGRSKSDVDHKLKQVRRALRLFHRHYVDQRTSPRNRISPYNTALSVCQHNMSSEVDEEISTLTKDVLQMIRSHQSVAEPDAITFKSLFMIIDSTTTWTDDEIRTELEYCCQCGYVTNDILTIVSRRAPDVYAQCVTAYLEQRNQTQLPWNWIRNCR